MRLTIPSLLALMVSLPSAAQEPVAPETPETPAPVDAPPDAGESASTPTETPPTEPLPVPVEAPVPTTGIVTGVVTDSSGIPYPGLDVYVGEIAVTTDTDGRFTLESPPGEYLITVRELGLFVPGDLVANVAAGATTTVDIPLRSENADDYEIIVYAPEVVGGVNASLEERKEAPAVTEVIGAEQMSKSGDSNASAALARVTGLTIVDGRFVYIRGMGERYSSTLLNLSTLPSPEPERRVVPLDLFPTGLLEQVTIYKTWTPDLPGEFGGGAVSLKTRGIPERPYTQITVTGGYVAQSTFLSTTSGQRGPTDWLGFGTQPRALPEPVAAVTEDGRITEESMFSEGLSPEELEALGESVDSSWWNSKKVTVRPDVGLQIGLGRRIDVGGTQLGIFLGGTYNNSWSLDQYTLADYSADGESAQFQYDFDQLTNNIILGGIANLGAKFSDHQGIYYTGVLTRSSQYDRRIYSGYSADLNNSLRVTRFDWLERQLAFHQLRGEHEFPSLADFRVDWRYAYSTAALDEPDQRDYRYDLQGDGVTYAMSDRPDATNMLFANLGDQNHDGRLDLSLPFGSDVRGGKLSVGGQVVLRDRASETRRFGLTDTTPDAALLALPIEQQFTPDNIGPDGYKLIEVTRATDSYTARQEIQAGYLMLDFPFDTVAHGVWGLRDLAVLAGARAEHASTTVDTFEEFVENPQVVSAKLDRTDVLPSVTLTQNFLKPAEDPNDDTLQLRAGWARTVSRPDFRELSPAVYTAVFGARQQIGNPELFRALIDHYDLRMEWYPRDGELLSVGAFYKDFERPIETSYIPGATPSQTWQNALGATNMGIELDMRKTLFGTGLGFLDRIYVSANASVIRSRVELDADSNETDKERPLEGQSPWVVNAQLGYDNSDAKTVATVSFNMAGPRIIGVGVDGIPNTIEEPVPRLDVLLQQGFARDFYVRIRGRNLLNPSVEISQGDNVVRAGTEGWSALLSLEYRP